MLPQAESGGSTRSFKQKTVNEAVEIDLVKTSASSS